MEPLQCGRLGTHPVAMRLSPLATTVGNKLAATRMVAMAEIMKKVNKFDLAIPFRVQFVFWSSDEKY